MSTNKRTGGRAYNPKINSAPSKKEANVNSDKDVQEIEQEKIEENVSFNNESKEKKDNESIVVNSNEDLSNSIENPNIVEEKNVSEVDNKHEERENEELPEVFIYHSERLNKIKGESLSNVEQPKQNQDVPHYVFKRKRNGKVEIINNEKVDENTMNKEVKNELGKKILESINADILKTQLEIEIHSEILKTETIPNDITTTQRKIDTFNANLDYLEKRKAAILKIIEVQ